MDTQRNWDPVDWALRWRALHILESHRMYCIELNRKVGSGIQLKKEVGSLLTVKPDKGRHFLTEGPSFQTTPVCVKLTNH